MCIVSQILSSEFRSKTVFKLKTILYEGANGIKPLVTKSVTICNYWYLRCYVTEVLLVCCFLFIFFLCVLIISVNRNVRKLYSFSNVKLPL
jgi:hypothetical protein